jgi:hypothetical protein
MKRRVSKSLATSVRQFAFWIANKSVGKSIIGNTDNSNLINESSAFEMAFAIFMNNLELDDDGKVLNRGYAEKRSAQYIKSYIEPSYKVEPEFEEFEIILHGPNE